MAMDFLPDDFVETYEDTPSLEGFDGGSEPMLEGAFNADGEDTNHGRMVAKEAERDNANVGLGGLDDSTSGSGGNGSNDAGTHGGNEELSGSGSGRVRSGGSGNSKRNSGNKGASGEGNSGKTSTSKPRKRKAEEDKGDNAPSKRKAVSSVPKGRKSDNTNDEPRHRVTGDTRKNDGKVDAAPVRGFGCGTKPPFQQSIESGGSNFAGGEGGGPIAINDTADIRRTRYLTNILRMEEDLKKNKESAYNAKTVDLVLLAEKIHEAKGIKCMALDAFIICNKQQLVCYGTFIDEEGKVMVGTRECEKNFIGLMNSNPNLDVELSDDVKKRLKRKWWRVPGKDHKKIIDCQNESVVQANGERYFTMTLTGYYCGSMIDRETNEKRITFTPTLVFMPYKAFLD